MGAVGHLESHVWERAATSGYPLDAAAILLCELDGTEQEVSDQIAAVDQLLREHGATELRVVEDYFGIDLPGKATDRVNLWILTHSENIPAPDDRFVIDGLEVTIRTATPRRIEQVSIRRITGDETATPADNPPPEAGA